MASGDILNACFAILMDVDALTSTNLGKQIEIEGLVLNGHLALVILLHIILNGNLGLIFKEIPLELL